MNVGHETYDDLCDYGPAHYSNYPNVPIGSYESPYMAWHYAYSIYDSHSRYRDPEVRYIRKICDNCRKVFRIANMWPLYDDICPYCGHKLNPKVYYYD